MKKLFFRTIIYFLPMLAFSQGGTDSLRIEMNKYYNVDIIKGKAKIDFKKQTYDDGFGEVLVNGKKQFKYRRFDKKDAEGDFLGSSFGIYKRKEKDVFFLSQNHTIRTPNEPTRFIIEFEFPFQNVKFLSEKAGTFSWIGAIKLALYEKVIDIDGKVNSVQLEGFVEKYNDIEPGSRLYNEIRRN